MLQGSLFAPVETESAIVPASTISHAINLRDYQREAIERVAESEARGVRKQLVVLPTAAGKTIIFSSIAAARLPGRTLILSHRDELVRQAAKKFAMVRGGVPVGIVKAETYNATAPVVSASVQTLVNRIDHFPRDWSMIVVDEAHHAVANTYMKILDALNAGAPDGPLLLGVTATADRGDKLGLDQVFDEIVYQVPLKKLVQAGHVANMRGMRIRIGLNLDNVKVSRGDYQAGQLGEAMHEAGAADAIAIAMLAHAQGRKSLIFTPTVATAYEQAEACRRAGISCGVVEGNTHPIERERIIADLTAGRIDAIANCAVLTEGTDIPIVDCIVAARPTKSRTLYTQMVGRGFRTYPGKAECLVLDIVGNSDRNKIVTLATLTGMKKMDGEVRETERGSEGTFGLSMLDVLRETDSLINGSTVATDVDLMGNSWAVWIINKDGTFLLPAGDREYRVAPTDGGLFNVSMRDRTGAVQMIAERLDIGYAQGVTEQHAESARMLIAKDAPWRSDPTITPKQKAILVKHGIDLADVKTKGEASAIISRILAGKSKW